MLKRFLLASAILAASAGVVFAFSGSHSFTDATTTTSDGHSYVFDYLASGTFPYDGVGNYNVNKVDLVGIYTLYSLDGNDLNPPEQYCVKTTGSINKKGKGKLKAKVYQDLDCTVYKETQNITVKSYKEDGSGNFTLVTVTDGITSTTTGLHSFSQ